jgi:predicted Zn finger-like uncharacterized protein
MEVKCTHCGTIYNINPEKIPSQGGYVTCRKCQTRFFLKKGSHSVTAIGVREPVIRSGLKKRVPILAGGLVALLVLGVVGYFLLQSFGMNNRRRVTNLFLEAIKNKELTDDNAWDPREEYVVNLSALIKRNENGLPKRDIFFPINLIGYKFQREEVIPKGFVRLSPDGEGEALSPVVKPRRKASTVKGVNGFYIQSNSEGRLFVIKGMVTNNFSGLRSPIPITGTLKDDHGRVLQEKTVYAGITLTEDQIKDKSLNEMNRALVNKAHLGDVGPGQTVPFTVVFGNPPGDMSSYTAEEAGPTAQPDKGKKRPKDKTFEALKKQVRAENPKQLKIDEENRVITFYDDTPLLYKLYYLLKMTDREGKVLKKNGWVSVKEKDGYIEIDEFKWK